MATLRDGGPLTGGPHDVGGLCAGDPELGDDPDAEFIANSSRSFQQWEREVQAMISIVRQQNWTDGEPVLPSWDPVRRAIESLPKPVYDSTAYFEKWALGFTQVLMQRGVLTHADLGAKLGLAEGGEAEAAAAGAAPHFKPGDAVVVRQEDLATAWAKPHLRTPGYIFGKAGTVERICGSFDNPELLTIGLAGPSQPLYRIRFRQADVWKEYAGHPNDTVDVEVYQPWLEGATVAANFTCEPPVTAYLEHTHGGDGNEESRAAIEQRAVDAEGPERPYRRVVEAIKMCLLDTGLVTNAGIRSFIEKNDMNKQNADLGAQVVAKAWVDPAYKQLLLEDGAAALAQLGIDGTGQSADLVVVENSATEHNLVVCTLCSCYSSKLLGWPPDWFKSRSYRARAVREPRDVLAEFGLVLGDDVAVAVHDSTADMRYLVLPQRPDGTEDWSEEKLRALATRDSMVGVCFAAAPGTPSL